MRIRSKNPMRSGFTMIELLTVMAILAILGGFGFGTYILVIKQSKESEAKIMLENISSQLEVRIAQGFTQDEETALSGLLDGNTLYPTGDGLDESTKGLYAVLSSDFDRSGQVDDDYTPSFPKMDPEYQGKGKYVNKDLLLIDPWQQPLRYLYPGDKNNVENGFDLWSAGPDGEFDTEDDINNW